MAPCIRTSTESWTLTANASFRSCLSKLTDAANRLYRPHDVGQATQNGNTTSLREDLARDLLEALINAEKILSQHDGLENPNAGVFASHRRSAAGVIANLRIGVDFREFGNSLLRRSADVLLVGLSDIGLYQGHLLDGSGNPLSADLASKAALDIKVDDWWNLAQAVVDFVQAAGANDPETEPLPQPLGLAFFG